VPTSLWARTRHRREGGAWSRDVMDSADQLSGKVEMVCMYDRAMFPRYPGALMSLRKLQTVSCAECALRYGKP
jgi:hypothetical protein